VREDGGKESHDRNLDAFVLDLERLLWRREPGPGIKNAESPSR